MSKSSTLRDIAKKAGVSASTVPRVLNDQPGIGTETREHVPAVVKAMQSVPNAAAQNLATKRTRNIGLITYIWSTPYRFVAASYDSVGFSEACEKTVTIFYPLMSVIRRCKMRCNCQWCVKIELMVIF